MQVITGLIQKRTADTEYNVEQPFSTIYWRPQHIQSVLLKSGRVCKHLCSSRITQKLSVIKFCLIFPPEHGLFSDHDHSWSFQIIHRQSIYEVLKPRARNCAYHGELPVITHCVLWLIPKILVEELCLEEPMMVGGTWCCSTQKYFPGLHA